MAGTRGLAKFKGSQLNGKIMRNSHFDENNKIDEKYLNIDFGSHTDILEAVKVDVFSQINNKEVKGLSELDVTADLAGNPVATDNNEGVVVGERVDLRVNGTEDTSFIDADGDRVYGKIEYTPSSDGEVTSESFKIKFYSRQLDAGGGEVETAYTFAADSPNLDFRYKLRTNLAALPEDAIVNGGSGFVEGATDATYYMNLKQLAVDLYGISGTLDSDGVANLDKSIVQQLSDLSTADEGIIDRLEKLETKLEEEVFEATGGETSYTLVKGVAEPKSVLLFINGQLQTPTINFEYVTDGEGNITGFNFTPDTLEIVNGVPDVLYVKYNKVLA